MPEITDSSKRDICPLCYVGVDRLVIRDPANLLRMEDADDSTNEALCHLGSVSGVLVCARELATRNNLT
jgi:hypothetical protein